MRIIVTGAGGFVGRALVARLSSHSVVAIDRAAAAIPVYDHVEPIVGDLTDPDVIECAFGSGCDSLVHLATVPGGAAEANPERAKHVNIDATMRLVDIAAKAGQRPRVVFASSVAVFGGSLPIAVDDTAPVAPKLLYGAHKAMMEQWIASLTRREAIDGISLRLSGVVARPAGPSGMKSAFLSDIFHAVITGERFVMPLSRDATTWLVSRPTAAAAFLHAITADLAAAPNDRAVTLPAVRVRIGDLVDAIAAATRRAACVDYVPDSALTATFGEHPPITTEVAERLGFAGDSEIDRLVSRTLTDLEIAE